MRSSRSSFQNIIRKRQHHRDLPTSRVHRLNAGLGSITTTLWERASRALNNFRVQKTEVQYDTALEVDVPTSIETGASVVVTAASGPLTDCSGPKAASSGSSSAQTGDGTTINLEVRVVDSISKVSPEEWDAVATRCGNGEVNPFLLWSFLHALEESGSAAPRTGWLPQHILVRQFGLDNQSATRADARGADDAGATSAGGGTGRLVGCVPIYLKGHSFGEYVFDNSWADFASMLGVRYYPKLQAAVPFTPVTGPRLMVTSDLAPSQRAAVVRALGKTLIDMADSMGISGVHLTFTTAQEWVMLRELGFKQRLGIQFHWDNNGYDSFEDFLADLRQSKRKGIRQERKSIQQAGLSLHRLPGAVLRPAHWDRFHALYLSTVDRKWGNAYLTREFFHRLGEALPDRVLLVAACEGKSSASASSSCSSAPDADQLVAGALNLVGSHALFGRNWGQVDGREYRNLHFELCYYQALEEAISRRLPRVEAGAQGEHKLQRGYLPSFTYSCHYLRDPQLGAAVDRLLARERNQVEYTLQVMSLTASPYKKERTVEALVGKLQSYGSLSSGSSLDVDEEA
ncbi:hypothetical protein Vretimale_2017 [Volvox reticuliferus]|uniref:Uncharacterized protein n=1 Tax=Volvox reticuliferus TaxID=1737510 RepID=A0A8J4D8Z5_9CHLO|nr:hypothetical protein Vretifemale_4329 [Volvox reticuliferus]GIL96133.1 hypothetical protein Vretimale_2017 [Volvox reticuliferus]